MRVYAYAGGEGQFASQFCTFAGLHFLSGAADKEVEAKCLSHSAKYILVHEAASIRPRILRLRNLLTLTRHLHTTGQFDLRQFNTFFATTTNITTFPADNQRAKCLAGESAQFAADGVLRQPCNGHCPFHSTICSGIAPLRPRLSSRTTQRRGAVRGRAWEEGGAAGIAMVLLVGLPHRIARPETALYFRPHEPR